MTVEQGPGPAVGLGQPGRHVVVDVVGRLCGGHELDAEDLPQRMVEPEARRRRPEPVVVGGEGPPHLAAVDDGVAARPVERADAEALERHALAVQHP